MSDVVSQGQNAVVIDQRDNVAVATYQLEAGAEARYPMPDGTLASVTVTDDIPLFHKIALVDIPKGEKVVKYGEFIGVATTDIKRGQHVHTHNCASSDDLKDRHRLRRHQDLLARGGHAHLHGLPSPGRSCRHPQPRPDPSHEHLCLRHHGEDRERG